MFIDMFLTFVFDVPFESKQSPNTRALSKGNTALCHHAITFKHPILYCRPMQKAFCAFSSQVISLL